MHEITIERILQVFKRVLGTRLQSFVMYGSSHTGEFHEGFSNINTLAIVSTITMNDIAAIGRELAWFFYKGNPPPLVFTKDELTSFKDVFPIEMLDMIEHHTLVYGEIDPLKNISIDPKNLRFQCESELKGKLIKLRQALFMQNSEKKASLLMVNSISSFIALFKGVLRLKGRNAPAHKRDILNEIAQLVEFDQTPFIKLIEVREKKNKFKKSETFRTLEMYIEGITKVIYFIEKE
ncbi:MAG: hypothetical protein M1591_00635 [Deltaproteobacteria bacterium]|nr:hypothetical protein [Deltaproteobacteria bacterium]